MRKIRSSRNVEDRARRPAPRPNFPVPASPPSTKVRLHAVDALRGTAIFFVVMLHSALAYTKLDIPRLVWGVRDASGHLGFDWLCWGLMGTSVPLFFAISGFLAAEMYESKGPSGFVKNRVGRILGPFLAALVVVGPLCFYVWAYGWMITGRCTLREIQRLRFKDPIIRAELLGPGHLWFLAYMLPMLVIFYGIRKWAQPSISVPGKWGQAPIESNRSQSPFPERWVNSAWLPLLLAIPSAVILWAGRRAFGVDAALDRHNALFWNPLRLLHHGSFFAMGAVLRYYQPDLKKLASRGWVYLLAAIPIFALRAGLLERDFSSGLDGNSQVILAGLGGLLSWLTTLGLIGVYRRLIDRPIGAIRYLADSSYWIYLIHMPIVGLIQADLHGVNLPRSAKFAIVLATTLMIGLASFEVMVRRTPVGRFLYGARRTITVDREDQWGRSELSASRAM